MNEFHVLTYTPTSFYYIKPSPNTFGTSSQAGLFDVLLLCPLFPCWPFKSKGTLELNTIDDGGGNAAFHFAAMVVRAKYPTTHGNQARFQKPRRKILEFQKFSPTKQADSLAYCRLRSILLTYAHTRRVFIFEILMLLVGESPCRESSQPKRLSVSATLSAVSFNPIPPSLRRRMLAVAVWVGYLGLVWAYPGTPACFL